ncbi:MAG: hypothetical protein AAF514_16105 [Verrucomicrobiota bacterium]
MKARSAWFTILFAIGSLVGISCERQSWEETRMLHGSHGDHHAEDGKAHKEGHDKDGEAKPKEGTDAPAEEGTKAEDKE